MFFGGEGFVFGGVTFAGEGDRFTGFENSFDLSFEIFY